MYFFRIYFKYGLYIFSVVLMKRNVDFLNNPQICVSGVIESTCFPGNCPQSFQSVKLGLERGKPGFQSVKNWDSRMPNNFSGPGVSVIKCRFQRCVHPSNQSPTRNKSNFEWINMAFGSRMQILMFVLNQILFANFSTFYVFLVIHLYL